MKRMRMKRGLSIFLCMLFCVGLMPAKVYAETPSELLIADVNILEEPDQKMELVEGTAEYDEETNTLTLNNATITGEGSGNTSGVISFGDRDLKIELIGQNTITSNSYCGIFGSGGTLTIQGGGSLAINSVYYGIKEDDGGNISINGVTLDIETGSAKPFMGNGIQAEGILEITGGANVTVTENMPDTVGLIGNEGILITDSTVTANVLSEEGGNNALISDGDLSIDNSVVVAKSMTKEGGTAISVENVKISNGSNVTSYAAKGNAINAHNLKNPSVSTSIEITDSKFTSTSSSPGLAADDIILENSTAIVESTANTGIFARQDLTIKGNSDITSRGATKAIRGKNTFKLIPPEGQMMDVFVGENEENAAVIEEAPLSQETDLTHYGKNGITYFRSTLHNHSWGDWESNGDNIHKRNCSLCNGEETAACSGGTATCSTPAICEICGGKHGETDATNHTNLVKVDAKPATHSESGNKEYWHCDGCNKYFSDKDAVKEIAYEDTVIPKLSEDTGVGNENEGREDLNKDVPKTGDTGNGVLWGIVMLAAGSILLSSILVQKRRDI